MCSDEEEEEGEDEDVEGEDDEVEEEEEEEEEGAEEAAQVWGKAAGEGEGDTGAEWQGDCETEGTRMMFDRAGVEME